MKKYKIIVVIETIAILCYVLFRNGTPSTAVYSILNALNLFVMPLLVFMAATDLFTGEIENGSIKASLLKPVSRTTLFLAKNISIMLYISTVMFVSFVMSEVYLILAGANVGVLLQIAVAYIASGLPILCFIAMATFVSMAVKSSSFSLFINIGLYVGMTAINLFYTTYGTIFFTTYLGWYKIWLNSSLPLYNISIVALILLSYMFGMFTIGGMLFQHKEI